MPDHLHFLLISIIPSSSSWSWSCSTRRGSCQSAALVSSTSSGMCIACICSWADCLPPGFTGSDWGTSKIFVLPWWFFVLHQSQSVAESRNSNSIVIMISRVACEFDIVSYYWKFKSFDQSDSWFWNINNVKHLVNNFRDCTHPRIHDRFFLSDILRHRLK